MEFNFANLGGVLSSVVGIVGGMAISLSEVKRDNMTTYDNMAISLSEAKHDNMTTYDNMAISLSEVKHDKMTTCVHGDIT